MTRRAVVVAVGIIALASILGACGVGAESQPQSIDRTDVPSGLARRADGSPSTVPQTGAPYSLYFVADDRLRSVTRTAPSTPGATAILRMLLRGTSRSETQGGLRTLLPPDLKIDAVTVDNGIATVSLGGSGDLNIASDEQALGVAQMVFTVTGLAGIDHVRFETNEKVAEVPRGDGTLSARPVERADYPSVSP